MSTAEPDERAVRVVRSCLWRRVEGAGLDRFELLRTDTGWSLRGTLLAFDEHGPTEAFYRVDCDDTWLTRRVHVRVRDDGGERSVEIDALDGRWLVNGREDAALHGCLDVDLQWSPATNTLPIRRLELPVGADSTGLRMAWVRFPALTIEPLPQEYRRMADRTYRYSSNAGTFVAELEVDDVGVVVDYQGIWARVRDSG